MPAELLTVWRAVLLLWCVLLSALRLGLFCCVSGLSGLLASSLCCCRCLVCLLSSFPVLFSHSRIDHAPSHCPIRCGLRGLYSVVKVRRSLLFPWISLGWMPSVTVSPFTVAPFAASLLSAVVLAFACLLFCCKVHGGLGMATAKGIVSRYRHLVKCYFADVSKALCRLRLRAVPAAPKYTKYWKLCAKYRKNGLKKWSKMCRIFLGIDTSRSLAPQGIQGIFR